MILALSRSLKGCRLRTTIRHDELNLSDVITVELDWAVATWVGLPRVSAASMASPPVEGALVAIKAAFVNANWTH